MFSEFIFKRRFSKKYRRSDLRSAYRQLFMTAGGFWVSVFTYVG